MPFLGLIIAAIVAAAIGGGAYTTYSYYNDNNNRDYEVFLALFFKLNLTNCSIFLKYKM